MDKNPFPINHFLKIGSKENQLITQDFFLKDNRDHLDLELINQETDKKSDQDFHNHQSHESLTNHVFSEPSLQKPYFTEEIHQDFISPFFKSQLGSKTTISSSLIYEDPLLQALESFLKRKIPSGKYIAILEGKIHLIQDGPTLYIEVVDSFCLNMIEDHFKDLIRNFLIEIKPELTQIHFRLYSSSTQKKLKKDNTFEEDTLLINQSPEQTASFFHKSVDGETIDALWNDLESRLHSKDYVLQRDNFFKQLDNKKNKLSLIEDEIDNPSLDKSKNSSNQIKELRGKENQENSKQNIIDIHLDYQYKYLKEKENEDLKNHKERIKLAIDNTHTNNSNKISFRLPKNGKNSEKNKIQNFSKKRDDESKSELNSKKNVQYLNPENYSIPLENPIIIPLESQKKAESHYLNKIKEQLHISYILDPQKTFQKFIVGPSNHLACSALKAVSQAPGQLGKYPSLILYGPSGLGKTHLLNALAQELSIRYPKYVVAFMTARDFMNEMIMAIQENKIGEFRKKYCEKIDVLLLDDIHDLKDKTGTQNELFNIFNEMHQKGKQIVLTSDKSPEDIRGIEERIKTRLQWGLVIPVDIPELETRIAIAKQKAESMDLFLSHETIYHLSRNFKNNIRELEGALIKITAYKEIMKVEMDDDTIKTVLNLYTDHGKRPIDLDLVCRYCCQEFGILLPDLISKSRNAKLIQIRHYAMYLCQKLTKKTLSEIGEYFQGRDHTTILHAINKVKYQLTADDDIAQQILNLENLILNSI